MPEERQTTQPDRLLGLDAVRAFALLGITLVNVKYFAQPSTLMYEPHGARAERPLDAAATLFTSAFCEVKFFPLFSLLFGMGLALMLNRWRARGRSAGGFVWMYLRRLAVLAAIGAAHALFIWYGDILFVYAGAGLALLVFHWVPPRAMLIVGAILLAVGVFFSAIFMAASAANGSIEPLPATLAELPPVQRFLSGLTTDGGKHLISAWKSAETEAFSQGPYGQAVGMRLAVWLFSLTANAMSFGWVVLGMFFLGAGLGGMGFFDAPRAPQRRLIVRAGLLIGLPLAAAGAAIGWWSDGILGGFAAMFLGGLAGPLLALMWAAVFAGAAVRNPGGPLLRFLAVPGRMALTNYLLISLLGAAIWQHWGLGLFGTTTPATEFAIAVGLFAIAVTFSHLWMRVFTAGPVEWVWRCATNLEARPLLRRAHETGAAIG